MIGIDTNVIVRYIVQDDPKQAKAATKLIEHRFITLVFMQNDQEVDLTQYGNDLLVQSVYDEANN